MKSNTAVQSTHKYVTQNLKRKELDGNLQGGKATLISQSPLKALVRIPFERQNPDNPEHQQQAPAGTSIAHLRGLALTVVLGGTGSLLAQQRGHLLDISMLHGLQQAFIILVPLVGL